MPDCGIMQRMDIRILRYFIAVAEEGNITKAAARLHVSQPALSTQLAALEDELGQRLFERGARGIELTEKGLVLKRRADDLVDFAERIESELKANGDEELEGTVSIGAGETPAFRFIARAATQLARDNPRLRFSISSRGRSRSRPARGAGTLRGLRLPDPPVHASLGASRLRRLAACREEAHRSGGHEGYSPH